MTTEDLEATQASVGPALEDRYGDLEEETASVQATAKDECGLSLG